MAQERLSAAFFDLDRTLISGSSLYTFGRAAWKNDMVTTGQLLSDLKSAIAFRFSGSTDDSATGVRDRVLDAIRRLRQSIGSMLMGSFLGYFVGILPAAGATPGSLMAYGIAKTMSRDPDSFGKGNITGVAAPEAM